LRPWHSRIFFATALVAPPAGASALCSLKSNFLNLIHQADISVQGKTLESINSSLYQHMYFQLISEMSENDLKTLGHSVGFSPVLDNPRAARYNPTQSGANGYSGNGLCNNRPFSSASEYQCLCS
jgi:heat shock protein HslJ